MQTYNNMKNYTLSHAKKRYQLNKQKNQYV